MEGAGARTTSSRIGIIEGFGSRAYRLCRGCRFGGVCIVSRVSQLMLARLGLWSWEIWEDETRGGRLTQ